MVMVESAMLGLMASGLGLLFAWQAAPLIVSRIHPPDDPAQLVMPADASVIGFGLALAILVTLLFRIDSGAAGFEYTTSERVEGRRGTA